MINMDQVRTLEMKVKQTVQLIVQLRKENDGLRGRLSDTEVRLQELETVLESLNASQTEMESGIRSALQELDHLEDSSVAVPEPLVPRSFEPQDEPIDQAEFIAPPSVEPDFQPEPTPEFLDESTLDESWSAGDEETAEVSAEEPAADEPSEEPEPQQPGLGIF